MGYDGPGAMAYDCRQSPVTKFPNSGEQGHSMASGYLFMIVYEALMLTSQTSRKGSCQGPWLNHRFRTPDLMFNAWKCLRNRAAVYSLAGHRSLDPRLSTGECRD